MPKKLPFQVVHVSGYDEGHGPKELEVNIIILPIYKFLVQLLVKQFFKIIIVITIQLKLAFFLKYLKINPN